MAFLEVRNVKITGLSACVPKTVEENNLFPLFSGEEAQKFIVSTGIERRRKAHTKVCTSDLCCEAAEKLIADLKWDKKSIDCLILVTQTPDYILPATSCILQNRLDLSEECYTLDISLGCSGWVYGLSVITSLLSTGSMKRGLLLVGDTSCRVSPADKSTYPLFGDAGTVTALEYDENAKGFQFHLGSDGSGFEAIIIPDGGCRNLPNAESFEMKEIEPGIKRNNLHTILEGMDIFSFGIGKAPETMNKLISHFSLNKEEIDYFVFHQANLFLNEKIRKKLNIPVEKAPYSLKNFGNTASATIPLTMVTELKTSSQKEKKNIIACGFGVGLSWASVAFELNKITISDLVEI